MGVLLASLRDRDPSASVTTRLSDRGSSAPSPTRMREAAPLHQAIAGNWQTAREGGVPADCAVRLGAYTYAVLPCERPDAPSPGHDMWNLIVDVPDGWEVLSTRSDGFSQAMHAMSRHRWGCIVLGVKNANKSFDAYWTPLFSD